jgi:2-polyprenyl-6-hydroxyphenyl methylase/3-demethylubiquinone-9 3-methyltransferase
VASKNQNCNVEIFEPHSNDYTINSINELKNVKIVNQLGKYDCLISTDVLEHVPDPLLTFREMIDSVVSEGYLIIANNFNPVIKCHLPRTFHLRYTFNCFAKLMGLQDVGMLKGSHATIYVKKNVKPPKMCKIKIYEIISKTVYPVLRIVYPIVGRIKHLFAA